MNQRLCHDVALMMAEHCVEMLRTLLGEEELISAREEFYHVCKAGLEIYQIKADRLQHRLNPTQN